MLSRVIKNLHADCAKAFPHSRASEARKKHAEDLDDGSPFAFVFISVAQKLPSQDFAAVGSPASWPLNNSSRHQISCNLFFSGVAA